MTIRPTPAPTPPAQGTRKGYPYHIRSVHLTMNGVAQPRRMVGAPLAGALGRGTGCGHANRHNTHS